MHIYRMVNFDGDVLYVGKSIDVRKRLYSHNHLPEDVYKQICFIDAIEIDENLDLDYMEKVAIFYFKPTFNIQSIKYFKDIESIEKEYIEVLTSKTWELLKTSTDARMNTVNTIRETQEKAMKNFKNELHKRNMENEFVSRMRYLHNSKAKGEALKERVPFEIRENLMGMTQNENTAGNRFISSAFFNYKIDNKHNIAIIIELFQGECYIGIELSNNKTYRISEELGVDTLDLIDKVRTNIIDYININNYEDNISIYMDVIEEIVTCGHYKSLFINSVLTNINDLGYKLNWIESKITPETNKIINTYRTKKLNNEKTINERFFMLANTFNNFNKRFKFKLN